MGAGFFLNGSRPEPLKAWHRFGPGLESIDRHRRYLPKILSYQGQITRWCAVSFYTHYFFKSFSPLSLSLSCPISSSSGFGNPVSYETDGIQYHAAPVQNSILPKNPPGCLYSDVRWWSTSCPVLMYLATSFMFHCSFNWTSAICHAVAWLVYWFSGMTMKCDFMEEKEAPGERITRA